MKLGATALRNLEILNNQVITHLSWQSGQRLNLMKSWGLMGSQPSMFIAKMNLFGILAVRAINSVQTKEFQESKQAAFIVLRWYLFLFSHPKVGVKVSGVLFLFGRSLNVTFVSSSFGDRRMVVWGAACCGCWTTLALILGRGWWGSGWASPSQTRSEYTTLRWMWPESAFYEPVCSAPLKFVSAVSKSKLGYWFEWFTLSNILVIVIQYDIVTLLHSSPTIKVNNCCFRLERWEIKIFSHSWNKSSAVEALAEQASLYRTKQLHFLHCLSENRSVMTWCGWLNTMSWQK